MGGRSGAAKDGENGADYCLARYGKLPGWHGDPIGGVELMNQDGTSILPFVAGDSRSASELEKGKEYSIEVFTGAVEYELFCGFSPGNYIAEASVAFKFGENAAEELVCVLDLPFAVT